MQKLFLALALGFGLMHFGSAQELNKKQSISPSILPASATLDSTLSVPSIDAFNISPNSIEQLRQVDSKTYQNELSFTAAAEKTRYFFDEDSNLQEAPTKSGYYRDILGTTADGKIVAQDFYQDSSTPQTAPFILTSGKEKDFSTASNDGRVIWYTPEGIVSSIADYAEGKQQNWSWHLSKLGQVRFKAGETLIYDDKGRLLSHLDLSKNQLTLYYSNGNPMISIVNGKKSTYRVWNEAGEEGQLDEVSKQVLTLHKQIDEILQHIYP